MRKTVDFEFGGTELELRFSYMNTKKIENKLKEGLTGILLKGENNRIPTVSEMLTVVHGAQMNNPKLNINQLESAYEKYIDEDSGTDINFFQLLMEAMSESGFFGNSDEELATEE